MEYSTSPFEFELPSEAFVFEVNSLYEHLQKLTDQRRRRGIRYPLVLALVMIILAKLGGEDGPRGMSDWLKHRMAFLTQHLKMGRASVPHPVTISRILGQAVDAEQFEMVVGEFFRDRPQAGKSVLVTMDGKTLRSTIPLGERRGVHLLAIYLPEEGLVLMQMEVDQKENEIVVAPQALQMIDLKGKIVIGDALHTQRAISLQIVTAGGHFCWTVKDNQPLLRAAIEGFFQPEIDTPGFGKAITDLRTVTVCNKGHGRLEKRTLTTCGVQDRELEWPFVRQVFQLQRRFIQCSTGEVSQETVFGLTSLPPEQVDPQRLLEIVRGYWGIENGLHYRRDVTLKEDRARVKIGHAARVMAILNNLVLGLIARNGDHYAPEARRRFAAQPEQALHLVTHVV